MIPPDLRIYFQAAKAIAIVAVLLVVWFAGGAHERGKWEHQIALQKAAAALKLAKANQRTLETERALADFSARVGKRHAEQVAERVDFDRKYRALARTAGLWDREARCGRSGGDTGAGDPAAAARTDGPETGCRLSDAAFDFLWDLAGAADRAALTAGSGIDYAAGVREILKGRQP